jgi:putative transposase
MLINATETLAGSAGVTSACESMDVARSTFYHIRGQKQGAEAKPKSRSNQARKLDEKERQQVMNMLHCERFVDKSPAEIWATLLDEETYLCSERTMYRILDSEKEVKERRNQRKHPEYKKPELLAEAPNQVWSWDITKLKGPVTWTYYYLYVILDIYSRYVVGWMVAPKETAALAQRLIKSTYEKQGVKKGDIILHADRGSPMIAKTTAQLCATLGITKSYNRPHVSNDNPYSESQFKTLKYSPGFPDRFGSLQDSVSFCRPFFGWYNNDHRHSGIGMVTPADMHYGLAENVVEERKRVLKAAYKAHPERFVKGIPLPPVLPKAAWINPPVNTLVDKRNLQ